MGTSFFPSLPGLGYPVSRTALWSTRQQEAVSGTEFRIADYTFPRYQWDLQFNILRSAAAYTEFQTLLGFINARQGAFDSFLYTDADDNSVTSQAIATGNAVTTGFPLVRTFGNFVEPVLAPNTVSAVYLAGASIASAGYSAPTNGALTQTSAGSLGATTYYVRSTWVTSSGETTAGTETSLAVSANNVLNVAAPSSPPTGVLGWNVYVSNSVGGSGQETKQNSTPIALGTAWVEPNTGLTTGAFVPASNTTGWSVSDWGSSTPGILTFAGTPGSGIAITADFTYYWPCRFVDDKAMFDLFMNQYYSVKKLSFMSVKN